MTGRTAERVVAAWLRSCGRLVLEASQERYSYTDARGREQYRTRRADLFGCLDLLALEAAPLVECAPVWGIQVNTTPRWLSERRRKLEAVPWPSSVRVSLVTVDRRGRGAAARTWLRGQDYVGAWSPWWELDITPCGA